MVAHLNAIQELVPQEGLINDPIPWDQTRTPLEEPSAFLQRNLRRGRERYQKLLPLLNRWEQIRNNEGNEPFLEGLDDLSDEQLLAVMAQLSEVAEVMLDQQEDLLAFIEALNQFRVSTSTWSPDADAFSNDLYKAHDLFVWIEQAVRKWIDTVCDQYEKNHPEAKRLPVEPMDLGPTNAARLPPVL